MRQWLLNTSMMHLILLVLPAACAWAFRRLNVSGAAVVGGLVAGVLLGPTIFGRVLPHEFEAMFIGGIEQRVHLEKLQHRHEAERLTAAGHLSADAIVELRDRQLQEYVAAERQMQEVRHRHQRPVRTYTYVFIAATLLAAGFFVRPESRTKTSPPRAIVLSALSIGLWASGLGGVLAGGLAMLLWDVPLAAALAIAAAIAVGPWVLDQNDLEIARQAEPDGETLIIAAGRVASWLAVSIVCVAMFLHAGWRGFGLALILLALPLGWLAARHVEFDSRLARRMRWTATHMMVPTLTACIAVKIELLHHAAFLPILVLVILSSEVRSTGALLGAVLPGGRPMTQAMRLVLGIASAGPTQLAITALSLHSGTIDEQSAYGLLLGAVVVELLGRARRHMAGQLVEAERALDTMSKE